jgi:Holliday junction resolvase RusA-like endonuclease
LNIIVYGEPVAKGSMKGFNTGKGIRLTNDNVKTKDWQTLIAYTAGQKCKEVADGPVSLRVAFYLPKGKTVKREHVTTRPDIDKLLRCVLDALTGIIYQDDAQVVSVNVLKLYAEGEGDFGRPRVEVIWHEAGRGDSA